MNHEARIRAQRYRAMAAAYTTLADSIDRPWAVGMREIKEAKERIEVTRIVMDVSDGVSPADAVDNAQRGTPS